MIESPQQPIPQASGEMPDETIESIALAGAAAIQRLIADRNALRNCISAQQQDLIALTTANQELLDRLRLFRRLYLEFGSRILAQLEQFDKLTREAIPSTRVGASAPEDDANLIALAHRLRPTKGSANSANGAASS
jgi:HPt (histidine-containing phosphotransfer) domain-containing protein